MKMLLANCCWRWVDRFEIYSFCVYCFTVDAYVVVWAQFGRSIFVCMYVYEDSNFGGFRIPHVYANAQKWFDHITDEVYNQMSHLLSIPNVFVSAIFRLITNCTREITPLESTNCTRNGTCWIMACSQSRHFEQAIRREPLWNFIFFHSFSGSGKYLFDFTQPVTSSLESVVLKYRHLQIMIF